MVAEFPPPSAILHDYKTSVPASEITPLTPFGGFVSEYGVANSAEQLIAAVRSAIDRNYTFRVIGFGETLLIPDSGFEGLIIRNCSRSFHVVPDVSQVIVDSGMPFHSFITQLATQGYGGCIHLLPLGGTIGGVIVTDHKVAAKSIIDNLRSITVLMPPTKLKPEVRVVRFQGSWLRGTRTKPGTRILDVLRHDVSGIAPVLVSVQLQLTSLRHDELERQLQVAEKKLDSSGLRHKATCTGPLVFADDGNVILRDPAISLKSLEKEFGVKFTASSLYQISVKNKPVFGKQNIMNSARFLELELALVNLLKVHSIDARPAHELIQ